MSKLLWVVRAGKNAAYADDFVEDGFVGIGFADAGEIAIPIEKETLESLPIRRRRVGRAGDDPHQQAGSKDESVANQSMNHGRHVQFQAKRQKRDDSLANLRYRSPRSRTGQRVYFSLHTGFGNTTYSARDGSWNVSDVADRAT